MSETRRYPQILIDLANAAIAGDESAYAPLHDAMIDHGYPLLAERHFGFGKPCPYRGVYCHVLLKLTRERITQDLAGEEAALRGQNRTVADIMLENKQATAVRKSEGRSR